MPIILFMFVPFSGKHSQPVLLILFGGEGTHDLPLEGIWAQPAPTRFHHVLGTRCRPRV